MPHCLILMNPSLMLPMIHSDIWGPSPTPTTRDSRYFVIFVDNYSCYTWLFLMKNQSELTRIYRDFVAMIKTQISKDIMVFCMDNNMKIETWNLLIFSSNTVLLFTVHVQTLPNKMIAQNVSLSWGMVYYLNTLTLPLTHRLDFGLSLKHIGTWKIRT